MNETALTQQPEPTQHLDSTQQVDSTPSGTSAKPKRSFWRRKPVWITAIVVGALALGGAGAAYAIDEFDEVDDPAGSTVVDDTRDAGSDAGDATARDADDVPLTDAESADASKAALAEAGGGTVTDVDRSDDPGVAFEVDVLLANGDELEVDLAKDFSVVASVLD